MRVHDCRFRKIGAVSHLRIVCFCQMTLLFCSASNSQVHSFKTHSSWLKINARRHWSRYNRYKNMGPVHINYSYSWQMAGFDVKNLSRFSEEFQNIRLQCSMLHQFLFHLFYESFGKVTKVLELRYQSKLKHKT